MRVSSVHLNFLLCSNLRVMWDTRTTRDPHGRAEGAFCNNHYSQINTVGYEHFCCFVKRGTDDDKVMCLRNFDMGILYPPTPPLNSLPRIQLSLLRLSSALKWQFIGTLTF